MVQAGSWGKKGTLLNFKECLNGPSSQDKKVDEGRNPKYANGELQEYQQRINQSKIGAVKNILTAEI